MPAAVESRRVVVGVDASSGSLQALRWAAAEAALLGTGLDVVHAWSVPVVVYPEGQFFEAEPFRDEGRRVLDRAIAFLALPRCRPSRPMIGSSR